MRLVLGSPTAGVAKDSVVPGATSHVGYRLASTALAMVMMPSTVAFVEKVPAGTAGGALTVWCHAVMIMFLTTGILYPQTLKNVMLMGMVVCMLLSAALIGLTKQNYDRTDMDFKALKTREVEAEEAAKSAVVDC